MPSERAPIESAEQLDILSAIWILSCNDEIPEMTYEGIKYRLGLSDDYEFRSLIQSRGELFRSRLPLRRLNEWKQVMLEGNRLPSWIRDKGNKEERRAAIEALKPDDIFRNQFRFKADAAPVPIDIVKWGLEHIERLRTAHAGAREEKSRRLTNFWIPVISASTALVAVLGGITSQYTSLKVQRELKYYEVELNPKRDGYASMINSLDEAYASAEKNDPVGLKASQEKTKAAFRSLEPFLAGADWDDRSLVQKEYQQFYSACEELMKQSGNPSDKQAQVKQSVDSIQNTLLTHLYRRLFPQII